MLSVEERNDRKWGALIHLSALLQWVIPVPGVWIAAPCILWMTKRNDSPFLDDQGKEAVNFNISILLFLILAVTVYSGFSLFGVVDSRVIFAYLIPLMFFLIPLLIVVHALVVFFAAFRANNGQVVRYPFIVRFLR